MKRKFDLFDVAFAMLGASFIAYPISLYFIYRMLQA